MRASTLLGLGISVCITLACESDEDCSLNGLCLIGDRATNATQFACQCDAGWTGKDCGVLDLAPATRWTGYNNTNFTNLDDLGPYGNSSWGGKIIQDAVNASVFHLFTSQFARGCGLKSWRPTSHIIRAESHTGPQGPYHFAQEVTDSKTGFRHNPDVVFSPRDRKYLMYTIGVTGPEITECTSLTYEDWPNNISVSSADDIRGPWTEWDLVVNSNLDRNPPIRATNPSPFPLWSIDNETSAIALCNKDYNIYTADTWNGTYTIMHEGQWTTSEETESVHWSEDPFIWRDKRGNWHSLNHWMVDLIEHNTQQWPRVGSHVFSRSLAGPWTHKLQTAFTSNVTYDDGSWQLFRRRERPKIYFSTDGEMTPLYLITGVQSTFDDTGYSFTHIQPIGSAWKAFEDAFRSRKS